MTTATKHYQPKELIKFSQDAITGGAPSEITALYAFKAGSKKNGGLNSYAYTDQMRAVLSFLNDNGYNDRLNYQQYRPEFVQLIRGEAVQTRKEVAGNIARVVAAMDKPTLARFSSFLQSEEKFESGFIAKRAADGTLAAVVQRAYFLGPNTPLGTAPALNVA
jgi:hypothetical protein